MSRIRTILGDIAPESLGACYAHEHIIIDHSHTTEQSPDFLRLVEKIGLRPGRKVRPVAIDEAADTIEVELDASRPARRASLGLRAAAKILLERI